MDTLKEEISARRKKTNHMLELSIQGVKRRSERVEPVMGDAGSCELLITSLDGRDVGEIVTDEGSC